MEYVPSPYRSNIAHWVQLCRVIQSRFAAAQTCRAQLDILQFQLPIGPNQGGRQKLYNDFVNEKMEFVPVS